MRRQTQINPRNRLTDGAVLAIGLTLAVALCAVIALVEMVFLA